MTTSWMPCAPFEAALDNDDFHLLLDIMAEAIYPEDPDLARRHINTRHITEDMLLAALDELDVYDVETVMLNLYDGMSVPA